MTRPSFRSPPAPLYGLIGARASASALALTVTLLLGGCGEGERGGASREDGTEEMVERLQALATEVDPESNEYANTVRVEALLARGEPLTTRARLDWEMELATELSYAGRFDEATGRLEALLTEMDGMGARYGPARHNVRGRLAVTYLKQAEQLRCVEARETEPCLVGVDGGAAGSDPTGESAPTAASGREGAAAEGVVAARKTAALYAAMLAEEPDPRGRWLLNVAHMLAGEHPDGVPDEWVIPPAELVTEPALAPGAGFPRFPEIAGRLGVDVVGHAGGAIMDDFDRDGDLDLMASGRLLVDSLRYFTNEGDGRFVERTHEAGLTGLVGGLNMVHADYDNDGFLDVLVLRGGWLRRGRPNSLLRNNGDGTFSDVTARAGLLDELPTQTAAWGDFDNDGWLDLYVGNESRLDPIPAQLFRNNGDGTFTDVAPEVGAAVVGFIKAVVWGDVDNDGRLDLYVSSNRGANVLLRNEGPVGPADPPDPGSSEGTEGFVESGGSEGRGGTGRWTGWSFRDITREAGVAEPVESFPAWFFDYDNDGWLDLFVSGYDALVGQVALELLGEPHGAEPPRLYRNRGDGSFEEVSGAVELDRVLYSMGSNYGDLDNDGYPDVYVGTGDPDYHAVMPSRMFLNDAGRRFLEVTTAGGFGHIGKGHGVAFGDLDHDGDQDVYVTMGGAVEGDRARNALYLNPGHGNRWLTLLPEGTTSNRDAIGARVRVEVDTGEGPRTLHSMVSAGGSFGASSLRHETGLGDARSIRWLEITWPATGRTERFTDVEMDRAYRVREGEGRLVPVELDAIPLGAGEG